ncbi:MAG: hypothetical protein MUE51_01355 [Thermoleophilia bacterium]|nr:hypothetical protein [Thermoleophilia bacterium]
MSASHAVAGGVPTPEEAAVIAAAVEQVLAEARAAAAAGAGDARPAPYRSNWRRTAILEASIAMHVTEHSPMWRVS